MKRERFLWLILFFLIIPFSIGLMTTFHVEHSPKIATVNINAIVDNYIKTMAKMNVEQVVLEKSTAQFMQHLEIELARIAKEKKVVLFLSEAVLTPSMDLTDLVQKRIERFHQQG
jgi:hypothetical protein